MSKKPTRDPHRLPPAEKSAVELASLQDEAARLKAEVERLRGLLKYHTGKEF